MVKRPSDRFVTSSAKICEWIALWCFGLQWPDILATKFSAIAVCPARTAIADRVPSPYLKIVFIRIFRLFIVETSQDF